MKAAEFRPRRGLRSPHIQSILASGSLRRWLNRRSNQVLLDAAQARLIDAGNGVRLQGFLSQQPVPSQRGLAILLHGWEGSVDSTYLLHTGAELFRRGFDVFRLNFRDHGGTQHLNEDLFHSCRLDEVVAAVRQVTLEVPAERVFLSGFSLGGNFTLRVALKAPSVGLKIAHAVAVCPVISPTHCLNAIESAPWFYQKYFVRKWMLSLKRKALLFPERYDFSEWHAEPSLRELTRLLVDKHTDFATLDEYLDGYSIAGDRLQDLSVPATIVMASDDPVIPIRDVAKLKLSATTELDLSPYGGHCGFIADWRLGSWIEHYIAGRFERACNT